MKIGEIFTEQPRGGIPLSLMDRIILHQALTALESFNVPKYQKRIRRLKCKLRQFSLDDFVRFDNISMQSMIDLDDKNELVVSINQNDEDEDLPRPF